jgi:adenosylmethionine-8-amino-7-oxononanoate aminotransferase
MVMTRQSNGQHAHQFVGKGKGVFFLSDLRKRLLTSNSTFWDTVQGFGPKRIDHFSPNSSMKIPMKLQKTTQKRTFQWDQMLLAPASDMPAHKPNVF